jgi:signal transduction histidine kinase
MPSPRRGPGSLPRWSVPAGLLLVALVVASRTGLAWAALGTAALVAVYVAWALKAGAAARQRQGWERSAWRWIAAAGVVMAVQALAYFVVHFAVPSVSPDWGARSLAPTAAYPLLIVGFLHLARREGPSTVVVRGLDALLVAGGVFFVLWSSVFRDLFDASPLAFDERIEVMGYPTLGAALAVTVLLILGREGLQRRSYVYCAMAATAPLATDVADSILELGGNPHGALLGDAGFAVASLLWLLAALQATSEPAWPEGKRQPATKVETFLPIAVLALAIGTAIQTINEHGAISLLQFWMAVGLIATLLARLGVTLVDNMRLEAVLRQESAFKTQLLRFIAHEVANPLSPLRLQASLLRQKPPEETSRGWDIVDRSIDRLFALSHDVREMALAETQRLVTQVEVADAGEQAAVAAQAAVGLAQQRGLELVMQAPLEPLRVRMDRQRFGQVLDNLLSNALKFTHAPGKVTVRVAKEGTQAKVTVTDTGIGLSRSDQEGLFQPFRRAQDGAAPGLGLGLYLCKAIMTEMHGRIGVESPGRGQGATFWILLPLEGSEANPLPLGRTESAPAVVEPAPSATVRLA